jgi:hypothetical protein
MKAGSSRYAAADYAGDYSGISIGAEDGALVMRRDRRPPWVLQALNVDTFTVKDEPTRRLVFERGPDGVVKAVEIRSADGRSTRYARGT